MALAKKIVTRISPISPCQLVRNMRSFSRRSRAADSRISASVTWSGRPVASMAGMPVSGSEGFSDTGIKPGYEDVGKQDDEYIEAGGHQNRALHDGEVARHDGVEDQLADAGSGEDDLGEDGRGDHAAKAHADQRDGGQDGDAQRVAEDHPLWMQPEGAGRADIVLAHHFEHRGPNHAREITDPAQPNGKGRKDQVGHLVAELT